MVYVTTGNHLMAPFDTNAACFPSSAHTVHHTYPLFVGDRAVAERFGQLAVRAKWTLCSLLPSWLCVGGGGGMEAERRVWRLVHHSELLEGRAEASTRAAEGGEGEQWQARLSVGAANGSGRVMAVVESVDGQVGNEQSGDGADVKVRQQLSGAVS